MEIEKSKFDIDNYVIVKEAISTELADFVKEYFLMKRKVVEQMKYTRVISPYINYLGTWEDPQMPNTYSHYADFAMETLLCKVKPLMEQETGRKLYENYSYARIYKYGDTLFRHKDRFSCEISTTLNLGGDKWPIFLEPSQKEGMKGVSVDLKPGDMLVYKGNILEHWREPFKGDECAQVFLHYNNSKTKGAADNMFDKRPHLGLPSWFKK